MAMASHGATPLALKKRKAATRSAGVARNVSRAEDDAPLPLGTVKKSKRAGADESEFVSVEVGLREFHKRMASSAGATPTKRATSKTKKAQQEDSKAKSPARAKKTVAATPDGRAETSMPPSKRRAPAEAKAAAASAEADAGSFVAAKDTLLKKKASAAAKKMSSTPSATATKRSGGSGALAEARAAAMQQQQARVQQRVLGLQRGGEVYAGTAVQVPDPPRITKAEAPPTPQQRPQSQTPPVVITPVTETLTVNSQMDSTQSSQGFIEEDCDEDLVFLQALDEVERKLQVPIISTAPTAPVNNGLDVPMEASAQPVSTSDRLHTQTERSAVESIKSVASALVKEEPIQATTAPIVAPTTASIPPELLAEYERLKRENEALRRSNDLLQAQKSIPPRLSADTKEANLSGATQTELAHDQCAPPKLTCAIQEDMPTVAVSFSHDQITQVPRLNGCSESPANLQHAVVMPTAFAVDGTEANSDEPDDDVEMASVDGDSRYVNETADSDCGGGSDEENFDGKTVNDDEDDGDNEDKGKGASSAGSRVSTIDRGNYAQYRIKDRDDEEDASQPDDVNPLPLRPPRFNPNAASQVQRQQPEVQQTNYRKQMAPPRIDDGSETESDPEILQNYRRSAVAVHESSSSSSGESDDDSGETGAAGLNVLEAALRAATGQASAKEGVKSSSKRSKVGESPEMRRQVGCNDEDRSSPPIAAVGESVPDNRKTKKRRDTNASATLSVKDKSTLMWPTLDDFYDFVLDLTPRRVLHSDPLHLQLLRAYEKARARLPMHYPGIVEYCDVQRESILEELLSSVRNAEQLSLHSSSRARLWLSSISPCSANAGHSSTMRKATAPLSMSTNVIFMESGFSGASAAGKNDFIVTFQENRIGPNQKSALSDFVGGDLLAMRSPQWREYDIYAFGIVLCSSVVAVGGASSHNSASSSNPDQLCVLVRAPSSTEDDPDAANRFASVMEMCLVNQGSQQWSWSLEQVHNLTTSAREFQAIKSVRFFKPEAKEMIMSGIIPEIVKSEQTQVVEPRSKLTAGMYEELESKYNPSQLHAILGAISDDSSISIIQGPPGTGKTKTILGVLSALLDGAALTSSRQAQAKSRIRVGASLEQKTSTAAIKQDKKTVAQESIRVLVAAPSNAAVDELILRLLSEGVYDARQRKSYRPRIVRVGRPESLQQQLRSPSSGEQQDITKKKKWRKHASEVEEILLENLVNKNKSAFPTVKQARQAIIQNAQIVFCTLSGAGSVAMCELQSQHFDALVIDEAAQAVEASLLIPFKFQPSRVVLVGDHRQLPATVISKRLIELGYDRSLFQRLVENGSRVFMLTQQYRMHPEISWFPSTYFYNSKLIEAPQMKEWTARKYHQDTLFRPFVFYDVLSGQQSQVAGSKSLRNVNEIECILALLTRLVVEKYPELEWRRRIGIIAPYKQQIYELRNELQRWEKKHDKRLDIEVNTVDGFQGREKEVIIYSCVRTSRAGQGRSSSRQNGQTIEVFWADERRMNVAITRAKSSLWIIGNSTLLKQSAAWRALITHAKDSRRYVSDEELLNTRNRHDRGSSAGRSHSHDRSRSRERGDRRPRRDRSRSRDDRRKR